MALLSLLTVVAIVDKTSGSRADGTEHLKTMGNELLVVSDAIRKCLPLVVQQHSVQKGRDKVLEDHVGIIRPLDPARDEF